MMLGLCETSGSFICDITIVTIDAVLHNHAGIYPYTHRSVLPCYSIFTSLYLPDLGRGYSSVSDLGAIPGLKY